MCSGFAAPGASKAAVNGFRKLAIAPALRGFIIGPCAPGPERFTCWPVGRAERTTGWPSAPTPSQSTLTSGWPSRFELSSSIQLPSSGASCGPPKHQPLPVVKSTPRPFSFARRTASPNAVLHAGERSGLSAGLSWTE